MEEIINNSTKIANIIESNGIKVIVLYDSNDRETKRLNKKQLKEVESGKNLEEIKENSSERKKFKRVALGGERGVIPLDKGKANEVCEGLAPC